MRTGNRNKKVTISNLNIAYIWYLYNQIYEIMLSKWNSEIYSSYSYIQSFLIDAVLLCVPVRLMDMSTEPVLKRIFFFNESESWILFVIQKLSKSESYSWSEILNPDLNIRDSVKEILIRIWWNILMIQLNE